MLMFLAITVLTEGHQIHLQPELSTDVDEGNKQAIRLPEILRDIYSREHKSPEACIVERATNIRRNRRRDRCRPTLS